MGPGGQREESELTCGPGLSARGGYACGAMLACGATGRSGERVARSGLSARERGCDGAGLAERREAVRNGPREWALG